MRGAASGVQPLGRPGGSLILLQGPDVKVVQFLSEGRYVASVADGKVTVYPKRAETNR